MSAPLPYQYFIKANPNQGKVVSGKKPDLNDLTKVIYSVNLKINKAIKPVKEKADTWSLYPKQGDCEDYVVSKRDALIKKGFGSRYLLIALCQLSTGEKHAVLVVKSKVGDYILDNLTNDLIPKVKSRYKWISIQSEIDPKIFN